MGEGWDENIIPLISRYLHVI